ncbi:DNA MISMATCH REPAIR PROTEIN MUTS FAMILY MEMBER [Salix viminalis]|uniref:DNA MISMATCH REPAIR PROTEIN MUTS FAMILY MEMBER n=1 Tax=Salix viminalis TaxID=40686 RepID=A0A9Q0NNE4_SALVM|nr:DNA MISMATCH REPAIR PROTEIN MUTS FAMILY MEMBER [Salix viminalis]
MLSATATATASAGLVLGSNWITSLTTTTRLIFFCQSTAASDLPLTINITRRPRHRLRYNSCSFSSTSSPFPSILTAPDDDNQKKSDNDARYSSLRVLEWDKLCDLVSSFATTSLGREACKEQLWSLNHTYQHSLILLKETNAAVQMHNHGACRLDFSSINLLLVKSGLRNARWGSPIKANEAMAVAAILESAYFLQLNLKAAIKEDADWHNRFMPLSQLIMEMVINISLVRVIKQVIDEDGSVRDSASSALKRARDQVQLLEKKLSQLIDSLIRNEMKETSFLEVSNVDGRWCINSGTGQLTSFKGLLLSSDSGTGRIIEPLSAVPLNDELQQARASVAKAEADVLLMLTEKMKRDLDDIEKVSDSVIQLDVINARATYSLFFRGASPRLYLSEELDESFSTETYLSENETSMASFPKEREWLLYMPKAYHPLILQQHRQNVQKAKKEASNAADVSALEQARPVPVDFFISHKTRVLTITGPNTGGKTICLKTVGLASMMAKSGLHVLSSDSVEIPWFDSVFADIGDEQSLSQSLSTFSGHLKQIGDIRSQSTSQSLVLLDEVGAGTNPLEGAALGMSLLESFADSGALLTIATTHHGELKSLKYSNDAFENACMEFDEVNLKPTYKILWGVPGRSNAINISEKLGLPSVVISNARELHGAARAEINEVIIDMERFKQDSQELLHEARNHLMLSKTLHEKLKLARRKIKEHGTEQRYRKMRQISEALAMARSILYKKVRQLRAHATQTFHPTADQKQLSTSDSQFTAEAKNGRPTESTSTSAVKINKQPSAAMTEFPEVGDMVQVSSLGRKATVLRVDRSKEEILVQAGNMKLKLKLAEIGFK